MENEKKAFSEEAFLIKKINKKQVGFILLYSPWRLKAVWQYAPLLPYFRNFRIVFHKIAVTFSNFLLLFVSECSHNYFPMIEIERN